MTAFQNKTAKASENRKMVSRDGKPVVPPPLSSQSLSPVSDCLKVSHLSVCTFGCFIRTPVTKYHKLGT